MSYTVNLVSAYGNPELSAYEFETLVGATEFVMETLRGFYMPVHALAAVQINRNDVCVYSYVIPDDDREVDAEAYIIECWLEAEAMPPA